MTEIVAGPPTRSPNGYSTNAIQENLGDYGLPDPTRWHTFFTDFDSFVVANWLTTEVGAGGTQALTDEDGGVLLLTNDVNDDDSQALQLRGEAFRFQTGKKLYFKARFKVSDSTQSQLIVGLQIIDTTPFDVTDGVYFSKSDGDQTLQLKVEKDNVATTTDVLEMADDTYLELGFFYDGISKIIVFSANSEVVASVTTNLPDDEDLTVSFFSENGEAVAKTMNIDYVFVAKER